jgi:hypothetical protein
MPREQFWLPEGMVTIEWPDEDMSSGSFEDFNAHIDILERKILRGVMAREPAHSLDKMDWPSMNRERGLLIDKNIAGTLNEEERARLNALNAYADCHVERVAPRPASALDALVYPEAGEGRVCAVWCTRPANHPGTCQDWPMSRERGLLIDKNIAGTLNEEERVRLDALNAYANCHIARPASALDALQKPDPAPLQKPDLCGKHIWCYLPYAHEGECYRIVAQRAEGLDADKDQ